MTHLLFDPLHGLLSVSRLLRVQTDCNKQRHGDNYHLPHSIVVLIIDKNPQNIFSYGITKIVPLHVVPFPIRCTKRGKVKREMQNKYKEETAKPCPNTILSRKGAIITDVTDEERTCQLGGGAGRSPIDRVIDRASVDRPNMVDTLFI